MFLSLSLFLPFFLSLRSRTMIRYLKELVVSLGGAVDVLQIEPCDPDIEFLLLLAEIDGL